MSSPSEAPDATAAPTGVIHDIGYRPYSGPRLGERAVAWAFFVTGLRNSFGVGRSGRSKILPMGLLALMLLPALILVGVLVQAKNLLNLTEHIVPYSIYPLTTQLLISVFVAAQAPALISRDLRFRTITLYLARPARRTTYVLVRLASLTAATFLLIGAPLLLLYVGGLLADLPLRRETELFLGAIVGAALLAACLATLAALVSALTIRRGLAVAAVIVVLLVSYTVVTTDPGDLVRDRTRDRRPGRRDLLAVHPGQRGAGVPLRLARGHTDPARQRRDGRLLPLRDGGHDPGRGRRDAAALPQGRGVTAR